MQKPEARERAREAQKAKQAALDARPFAELSRDKKKARIISEQGGACNHCSLTMWRGIGILLELEHRDGDRNNDDRDNLECICPNCHSQTSTWRGRNNAVVSQDVLLEKLRRTSSVQATFDEIGAKPTEADFRRVKALAIRYGFNVTDCDFWL